MSAEVQKLRERYAYAEQRAGEMQQLLYDLKTLQDKYKDILWHKSAHSGPQLYMAISMVELECQRAEGWLKSTRTNLQWAANREGIEI